MRLFLALLGIVVFTLCELCSELPAGMHNCEYNESCIYNTNNTVVCTTPTSVECQGQRTFNKTYICKYCHQTVAGVDYACLENTECNSYSNTRYLSVCTTMDDVYCLGDRRFLKYMKCSWFASKKWTIALWLSVIFGGIGIDRLYLGHYVTGVVKIFTLSALGFWTLIDFFLVATGYITPNDGSRYIS